ncbi:MAG TPA: hypothetical protein VN417_05190 [Candidatus Cryosericum sp.]|nr:hypothetical protein [Candidatus Cryosericum sp.]
MFQSSTAKRLFATLALAMAALTMLGCAAPLAQAAAANNTDVTTQSAEIAEPYSAYGAGGRGTSGLNGGNGAFGLADESAESVGYRGNSGQGTYGDDCDPAYSAADTTPSEALGEADLALTLSGYGSEGALDDDSPTVADMLTYALQDEYLARAEYALILSGFGSVRPFSNIIRAEDTHIDTLLPLFEAYGITAPADEGSSRAAAVSSLTAAYQAGVNAEVNNIAMYETFLAEDLPDDVRTVFESLMHASENHQRAFQNRL